MTDAPERIYLDGDVEVGDGMFPRCFENAKYASDPPVEYIRSDLASAKLATCEKYRDAYAECDRIGTQAVRDLEVNLMKAVEALKVYGDGCDATETTPCGYTGNMCCMTARAALAELGENDDE